MKRAESVSSSAVSRAADTFQASGSLALSWRWRSPLALNERRSPASSASPDVNKLTDRSCVKVSGGGGARHTQTNGTLFSGFLLPEGSQSASAASPPHCSADRWSSANSLPSAEEEKEEESEDFPVPGTNTHQSRHSLFIRSHLRMLNNATWFTSQVFHSAVGCCWGFDLSPWMALVPTPHCPAPHYSCSTGWTWSQEHFLGILLGLVLDSDWLDWGFWIQTRRDL